MNGKDPISACILANIFISSLLAVAAAAAASLDFLSLPYCPYIIIVFVLATSLQDLEKGGSLAH